MGYEVDNPGRKVTNSGIVPQIDWFHGPNERGYGFLQSFKTMSKGMLGARKMQVFSGLLEHEVLLWFLGTKFASWEELEAELLQTYCVVMSSTTL